MYDSIILRRLRAVNSSRNIIDVEADTSQIKPDGHGVLKIAYHGREIKKTINRILGKALIEGKPNKNLDSALRL